MTSEAENLRAIAEDHRAKLAEEKKEREVKRQKLLAEQKGPEIRRIVGRCVKEAIEVARQGRYETRIVEYDEIAHLVIEDVAKNLRYKGFHVTTERKFTLGRIDSEGYSLESPTPYAVWNISWSKGD